MKTSETKTTSQNPQIKKEGPFFKKEGTEYGGGEREGTPFFQKDTNGSATSINEPFFRPNIVQKEPELNAKDNNGLTRKDITTTGAGTSSITNFNEGEPVQKKDDERESEELIEPDEKIVNNSPSPPEDNDEVERVTVKSSHPIQKVTREETLDDPPKSVFERQLNVTKGSGQSLPEDTQSAMKNQIGADFSKVNIHTGPESIQMNKEVGAHAFTHKNDIYFNEGEYDPHSAPGKYLLAHELVHTIQQGDSGEIVQRKISEERKKELTKRAKKLYNAFEQDIFYFETTDEAAVHEALQGLNEEEITELKKIYKRLYSKKRSDRTLVDDIFIELHDSLGDLKKALATLMPNGMPKSEGLEIRNTITEEYAPLDANITYTLYASGLWGEPKPHVVMWILTNPQKRTKYYAMYLDPQKHTFNASVEGTYDIIAIVKTSNGHYTALRHFQRVLNINRLTPAYDKKTETTDLIDYRIRLEMHHLKMVEGGIKDQNFDIPYISTTGTNPFSPWRIAPDMNWGYYTVHPSPEAKKFFWYVKVADWTKMPRDSYYGYTTISYKGEKVYNLSQTGTSTKFPLEIQNIYTIFCEERDEKNNPTGKTAKYKQVVMSMEEEKQVTKFRKHIKQIDEHIEKIDEDKIIAVKATYVNKETGNFMPLPLYIGSSVKEKGELVMVDLTPGVKNMEFNGRTANDVIEDFEDDNTYPEGQILLTIPENDIGISAGKWRINTTGSSLWQTWSSAAGWTSLGLAIGGIVAAVIPGGQPVAAALFIAASGTGALSGGLSLYDRIQKAEISKTGIAIDVLGIASSIIGGAAAFKALKGSAATLLASRSGRYLLWAGFSSDAMAGVLISVEAVAKIKEILESKHLSRGQQIGEIVRILSNLVVMGGLLALSTGSLKSIKGRMKNVLGDAMVDKLSKEQLYSLSLLDDKALSSLKNMEITEIRNIVQQLEKNPNAANNILKFKPVKNAKEFGDLLETEIKKVKKTIKGLYDSIDPDLTPNGWKFTHEIERLDDEAIRVTTSVERNGKKGHITRVYDPQKQTLIMKEAFLDEFDKPDRWIPHTPSLVSGKGVPTHVYVTIQQMKRVKKFGFTPEGIKQVKMSAIENIDTILHLEWLKRKFPEASLNDLVARTHSVNYAETLITQIGRDIKSVKYSNPSKQTIDDLLKHYEGQNPTKVGYHNKLLTKYGMNRNEIMELDFDINLSL